MRLPAAGRDFGIIKATSKNVIPAPIFIGINSQESRRRPCESRDGNDNIEIGFELLEVP
jgi:hypothetical protein